MTRERMVALLELLVLEVANKLPAPSAADVGEARVPGPSTVTDPEWAYVKGLASSEIIRLCARLVEGQ